MISNLLKNTKSLKSVFFINNSFSAQGKEKLKLYAKNSLKIFI